MRVYELHFLDLCYGGCELAWILLFKPEPEIAKVSRLLRQESLPVYYDTVPLLLPLDELPDSCSDFYEDADHEYIQEFKQRFFHLTNKAPERVLAQFKTLQLIGSPEAQEAQGSTTYQKVYHVWEVELARAGKEAQVRYFVVTDDGVPQEAVEDGAAADMWRARIEEVVESMAPPGEAQRLRAVDRDTFARIDDDWEAWEEHMKAVAYFFPS